MRQSLRCINASHLYFSAGVILSSVDCYAVLHRALELLSKATEVNKREYGLSFFIPNMTLVGISHT